MDFIDIITTVAGLFLFLFVVFMVVWGVTA